MGTMTDEEKRDHRSFSQMKTWLGCPKSLQLGHIEHAPSRPGVWFAAGTSVHQIVEDYLKAKWVEENA